MGQSLSNLLTHIVFSTKNRKPFIQPHIEPRFYGYIKTICQDLESPLLQIGGMPDHIHMLINLSRKHDLSKFVNKIKSNSSKWIKTIDVEHKEFAWQAGYGGFSVGQLEYPLVIDYISNQKEHHKKISFQEEYLKFVTTYGIEYDAKYLWD